MRTNTNLGLTVDKPVGIAYLDKGFMVITDPTIVTNFDLASTGATGTSITFNHTNTKVSQSITCTADRFMMEGYLLPLDRSQCSISIS